MNRVQVTGTHVDITIDEPCISPDEALDLAAQLVTAANVANGYTTTGVFA